MTVEPIVRLGEDMLELWNVLERDDRVRTVYYFATMQ
jgi:hypothetical protein